MTTAADSWRQAIALITQFRDDRDWKQFHTPKELASQLAIEAGELLEVFLWKDSSEARREDVAAELADVFFSALLIANEYNFDINQIITNKLEATAQKYPVEKARGNKKKYTQLV